MLRVSSACLLLGLAACSVDAPDAQPIGGESAEIMGGILDPGHPYVVGVGGMGDTQCTGTLISRRTVLTAGHCIFSSMKYVHFGPVGTNPVAVSKRVRHPGFAEDGESLKNDLGILQLAADAPTQPAPLLRENLDNTPTFIGPNFTFVGYGTAENNGYGKKKVATFPIALIGPGDVPTFVGHINETEFYYAVPGKNTCNGDSGGPAFVIRGGVERHAGTTSWGDGPCIEDGVQSRTDLVAIDGFIQQQIDLIEGADNACRSNGVCDESCNDVNGDGQVWDPDCQEAHCGADGLCALACAAPVDPDCTGVNHCVVDGICDPTCAGGDSEDCAVMSGVPDAGLPDASPPDASPPDAGVPDAGIVIDQPDAGGDDTDSTDSDETDSDETDSSNTDDGGAEGGCGCQTGGAPRGSWLGGMLLMLGVALGMRRRLR